jgi:hypothetical protein
MTDNKSVTMSWCRMTRLLLSVWQLRVSCCGAPSLTRGWICNLLVQLLLGLARAITLGSKHLRTHDHILLSHLRLLPQPGGPGPRIYIHQEQCGPVIPTGPGFLFVASYDSQDCGGGILTPPPPHASKSSFLLKQDAGQTGSIASLFLCPLSNGSVKKVWRT